MEDFVVDGIQIESDCLKDTVQKLISEEKEDKESSLNRKTNWEENEKGKAAGENGGNHEKEKQIF